MPTCSVGGVVAVHIGFGGGPPKPPGTKQAEDLTCSKGEIISRDILMGKGHVDINCVGGCMHFHKVILIASVPGSLYSLASEMEKVQSFNQ